MSAPQAKSRKEQAMNEPAIRTDRVCPAAHAGWLSTPLRRLGQDPRRILRGLVTESDTAVDLGCGPGFFTLPMASMTGPGGTVIAVDLQQEMLDRLRLRAERAGLASRIRLHRCRQDELDLDCQADFALAFYMLHEVPDAAPFLEQVCRALKNKGRFLLVEPKGHVSASDFSRSIELAGKAGMNAVSEPRLAFSRAVLLERA
jgi:ubiquinone/menaquinone biosynthesis C-methylase UbiE